jgi:uncharacterized protein
VLLLVAVDDRQVRIQTGYGAEAAIPDSVAGTIIREDITPAFKEAHYDGGITQGVESIIERLEKPGALPETETTPTTDAGISSELVIFVGYLLLSFGASALTYVAAFLGRTKQWWPGGVLGLVLGMVLGQVPVGVAFGLLGLALDYVLSKNYDTWKLEKRTTDWRRTWGGFHSSSGSSSSSGFSSFGGGSSGGGGASGKW